MKAYLYCAKTRIGRIKSPSQLRNDVCEYLSESMDLSGGVSPSDVSIRSVNLSGGTDVLLVLDQMPEAEPQEIVQMMSSVRDKLQGIMQKNQGTALPYAIRTRIDAKHVPHGAEYTEEGETTDGCMSANEGKSASVGRGGEGIAELDYENRAKAYVPAEPAYSFNRVILPEEVLEKIDSAINILQYERKVFEEWGLYEIQPHPSSSLSFFGPSGTGKTMAAEAIAQKLGKKILKVSYADVESKYHGEGPKMVKAIFLAAANEDAVLFFDEADSLLSKRLTNVTQGSEQAINSMRSQLLICLEEFRGIVIFATNLVVNYDKAFLTRLISVEFKLPDAATRQRIWDVHIRATDDGMTHKLNIPLAEDVDTQALANDYEFAGREIRNAVIGACVAVAMQQRDSVGQADFIKACEKIIEEKAQVANAGDHTLNPKAQEELKKVFLEKAREKKEASVPAVSEN